MLGERLPEFKAAVILPEERIEVVARYRLVATQFGAQPSRVVADHVKARRRRLRLRSILACFGYGAKARRDGAAGKVCDGLFADGLLLLGSQVFKGNVLPPEVGRIALDILAQLSNALHWHLRFEGAQARLHRSKKEYVQTFV